MKKKHRPISFRKALLIAFACFVALFVSAISFVLIVTSDARLDLTKLAGTKRQSLVITSENGTLMSETVQDEAPKLKEHTKNAFVAVEDKRFYSHNGIDPKRIGGAIIANIKSGKKSQGASTITQQLIKNTHLSSDKTIKRKLSEMKLALELERTYSKDQIIEAYLNNIYFGNGCKGIEAASWYYFGKSASELDVAESALLAGLVKAPSATEPKKHKDKAITRKNLVLQLMRKQNMISDEELLSATNEKLNFVFGGGKTSVYDTYNEAAKNEACKILNLDTDTLEASGFTIETFAQDLAMESIAQAIEDNKINNSSACAIVINSQTGGVKAMYQTGKFDFVNTKRQPGSAIKPILVYGPAIEEGKVTPESFVLDSATDFGGYTPQNAGNQYSGWISVRKAFATSKNVPAVKILEMCGAETAKKYAKACGISFDKQDISLALALGGMTNGTTITELAGAYTTFPSGIAKTPSFVKCIKNSEGKIIYEHKTDSRVVFGTDTAYLVYDMMKTTAQEGTAKTLSSLPFEVASKTGTVGDKNGNTDCYNISVTSSDVCAVMFTKEESALPSAVNGSTAPTKTAKHILSSLYESEKPQTATMPNSVCFADLDSRALECQKLALSLDTAHATKKLFSKRHMPTEYYVNNSSHVQEQQRNVETEKQMFYSIVNKSPKIVPKTNEPTTKELNDIIQEILGL